MVYAQGSEERYALRDARGNFVLDPVSQTVLVDSQRWILGALSFFQGEAAEWARQFIEDAAAGLTLFNGHRSEFWTAFQQRF